MLVSSKNPKQKQTPYSKTVTTKIAKAIKAYSFRL